MFKLIPNILLLPIFVTRDIIKSKRSFGAKFGYLILALIFLYYPWFAGYKTANLLANTALFDMGISDKPLKVHVSGESMMPNITDGSDVELHSPKKYKLERGDIVSFKNIETGNLYYIKRIIGLPGETISVKNGYVGINDRLLQESYLPENLPTYGNTYISECSAYQIPENEYLVLGDNRPVSLDSRVIGFIDKADIEGVIKTKVQEKFMQEGSQKQILKANINTETLLQKINDYRRGRNINALVVNPILNEVADERVKMIRDNFDDWKERATPVDKLLENKDYRYNSEYEFVTFGYLDEKSIADQIFESPLDEMAFSSPNNMEIGISTLEVNVKECTFPIISVIITWPAIPSYSQETIDFWAGEEKNNRQLLDILQSFVGKSGYDQQEIRSLISTVAETSDIATKMNQKIKDRQWLDYQLVERYSSLVKESQPKLNSFIKQVQLKSSGT